MASFAPIVPVFLSFPLITFSTFAISVPVKLLRPSPALDQYPLEPGAYLLGLLGIYGEVRGAGSSQRSPWHWTLTGDGH